MFFEWDEAKNLVNKEKHGVSFKEAESIWEDVHQEVEDIARSLGEKRNATIGFIGGQIYVAIWALRGDHIRLISVRRARDHEKQIFIKSLQKREGDG